MARMEASGPLSAGSSRLEPGCRGGCGPSSVLITCALPDWPVYGRASTCAIGSSERQGWHGPSRSTDGGSDSLDPFSPSPSRLPATPLSSDEKWTRLSQDGT